ncbi:TMEM30A [Symbiodinium pilosum]|uniref:TMEM30A protein n=1 Tax=Symbiodinium pilosum TaxID=2952 RepID=A0A812PBZ7_SYMPI|nr:TMEM30A [Symbiodinium pilosum]
MAAQDSERKGSCCCGLRGSQRRKRWLQRRLRSYQPIPSPGVVLTIYIVAGCCFLVLGVVLYLTNEGVVELNYDYTDDPVDANGVVSFELNVDSDMSAPIWVYYQLSGFHQNHRMYVENRDDTQLMSPELASGMVAPEACVPRAETDGRTNYPCGMIAWTVFNDSFAIMEQTATVEQRVEVDSSARSIAWAGDVTRFSNLDPEAENRLKLGMQNQHALNMWMLSYFPPVECYQVQAGPDKQFVPVEVATRIDDADGSPREVPDCQGYMTGAASCNFARGNESFSCTGDDYVIRKVEDWGIASGHFLVWMRTSALPTFRKVWGRVDRDIKAGTRLKIYVVHRFPVREYYGRKAFIMTTSSAVGGRNPFLGIAYLVVGVACFIFAPFYFVNSVRKGRSTWEVRPA